MLNLPRYVEKLKVFASFGKEVATLSCCKRHTCGVVIFDHRCRNVLSIGYNGPASGLPNNSCTNEVGNCGCVHAEINALLKLRSNEPAILYTTVAPCWNCARAIINADTIIGMLYSGECRHGEGPMHMLSLAGVLAVALDELNAELYKHTLSHWKLGVKT